jgi:hypothetical protein
MSNPFSLPGDDDYTPPDYGTSGYLGGPFDWGQSHHYYASYDGHPGEGLHKSNVDGLGEIPDFPVNPQNNYADPTFANANWRNLWEQQADRFNGYWTPTPPPPPDPDFTFFDNVNQNIWNGVINPEPVIQYPPANPPDPYEGAWQWLMRDTLWNLPPELPTLPYGDSW